MSYSQALQIIEREGGNVSEDKIVIKYQQPKPVRLEQCFPNLKPREKVIIGKDITQCPIFEGNGVGIAINGRSFCDNKGYVAEVEITVDDFAPEVVKMPASWTTRKLEVYQNFILDEGHHTVKMRWLNPRKDASIKIYDAILWDKE